MTTPIKYNFRLEGSADELADFKLAQAVMERVRLGAEKIVDAAEVRIEIESAS